MSHAIQHAHVVDRHAEAARGADTTPASIGERNPNPLMEVTASMPPKLSHPVGKLFKVR